MYVDIKQTVWKRFYLRDNITLDELKEYANISTNNLRSKIVNNGLHEGSEYLIDTAEDMEPFDNGGQCTIEIYDDTELLFSNERKPDVVDIFKDIDEHFKPEKL